MPMAAHPVTVRLATSAKLGTTAGAIQGAIDAGTGGMGTPVLKSLTAVQVQNIATVLSNKAPPPPPPTTDGATLYARAAHPVTVRSLRQRSSAQRQGPSRGAIDANTGNMGTPVLRSLTAVQVQAIATVLNAQAPPRRLRRRTERLSMPSNCASCHNPLATTTSRAERLRRSRPHQRQRGNMDPVLEALRQCRVQAIANALPAQP
ncbi:MAG: hypothetical protein MZV70_58660 [Desulfobacterales bacterium]|nr:hypothetical protein [Desulfobacterales bacterium]